MISRGQDENAFAVSKCRHFSSWRSIHCEREMSPFRKIDWRCSCRFRGKFSPVFDSFLSVHRAVLPRCSPFLFAHRSDETANCERFSTDLSSSRGGEGERKAIYASASWITRFELIRSTSRPFEGLNCGGKRLGILLSARSVGGSRQTLVFLLSCHRAALGKLETQNLDGKKFRSEDSSRPSASSMETATRNLPQVVRRSRHRSVLTRHVDYRTLGKRVFQEITEILGYSLTQLAKVDSVWVVDSYPRCYSTSISIFLSIESALRLSRVDLAQRTSPAAALLKFPTVAPFPFAQKRGFEKPKASISRKLGRRRLEKVAWSEAAARRGNESQSYAKATGQNDEEGWGREKRARKRRKRRVTNGFFERSRSRKIAKLMLTRPLYIRDEIPIRAAPNSEVPTVSPDPSTLWESIRSELKLF